MQQSLFNTEPEKPPRSPGEAPSPDEAGAVEAPAEAAGLRTPDDATDAADPAGGAADEAVEAADDELADGADTDAGGGGAEPPPDAPPPDDDEPPPPGTVPLLEAARTRYLNYALSVITARALPDVRDGLKPVQRRILYAMYSKLRLLHTARFRKSAAVVGEVMARYHPHGDQSIYDAMVRMAQPFSLRSPLVEGHGNFGSLDGDPPAAMRYTESRLRSLAEELVKEIDSDTVAFRANYDGTTDEPVVLPARFPNLLVNGAVGIAVGMATSIPPHNLREVCRACVALIDKPGHDTTALMEHVEGPDFPNGGEILNGRAELLAIYETGRGSFRLRSTYRIEKHERRRWLVIDTIPYGQNKAALVEAIGDAIANGKVPQLLDVRDESTDDIRIVLELKRGANDAVVMAWLYKNTNLRTNVPMNLTVLLPTVNAEVGTPALVGLRELLLQFNAFRLEVVRRRFEYELRKLQERIHILRGFVIVFDALDEAIAIIRASEGKKDAAERLMARFPLDALQTDAILELKLYRLAKLQILVIREELAKLEAEAARIEAILASRDALWGVVRTELLEVAQEHGDERRTLIGGEARSYEFDASNYIVRKDTWVIVTRGGWIKRQKGFSDLGTIRVREGDECAVVARCSTRSAIAFFTDRGRCYVMIADDIPQTSGYGEPIQAHFKMADGERVVAALSMDERNLPEFKLPLATQPSLSLKAADATADGTLDDDEVDTFREDGPDESADASVDASVDGDADDASTDGGPERIGPLAVAITRHGKGLLFPLANHSEPSTKSGRKFASLDSKGKPADGVVGVVPLTAGDARVCLATDKGRALVFEAAQLKLLQGSGKGVNAIRLSPGDAVLDFVLSAKAHKGLIVETNRGAEKRVTERKYGLVRRGGKGFEMVKRGGMVAIPRDPLVIDPTAGSEPEDVTDEDLDALEEALADGE